MLKSIAAGPSASESLVNGNGWIFLQDFQYTLASPLLLSAGVKMKVPNNTAGLLTLRTFAPESAVKWYDPLTSTFHADAAGDFFLYRLNFTVEPSVNNRNVTIDFSIGTANSPFETTQFLSKGAGNPTKISLPIPISVNQGMIQNGGTINLVSECDVKIYKISIVIHKTFKGPIA